ncbi:MAG TPA: ABC transporter permease [Cyclobacteriaceae bacterium]|jgi:putative ABC transport system permease protein|nr:ABC transporter permease [Cyclobacteriaceae bacterium]
MLINFIKTAWRNILRYKAYSAINFIGLTCGLTVALLIFSYTRSELSYDGFHEKAPRLYRFWYLVSNGLKLADTPPPIAPLLKEYFPQVEEAARLFRRNVSVKLPENSQAFEESNVFFADSAFTKMFTLEFISGNPERALKEKYTVVLNQEMATKYFGNKNPIGESLLFSGKHLFKVVGVVKNFPENSHIRFNMLVPYDDMFELEDQKTEDVLRRNLAQNFVISHSYTYVLLKEGANPSSINEKMGDFLKKYAHPRLLMGQIFTLMPVTDIHLKSTFLDEPSTTNSMTNIYVFICAGILTLLIACINYINLSTAQSLTRIKEIGIRKILGSMKYQLISQFLAESFLFCLIALLISFLAFDFTLPLLNMFTGKHLVFAEVVDSTLVFISIGLLLAVTVLAGGYPAYFVTKFESVSALKGSGTRGHGNQVLRKSLVVVQLTIACVLLSGTMLIVKQLNYLEERPLGFTKEHVINVPLFSQNFNGVFRQADTTFTQRLQNFRTAIEAQSGIKSTTLTSVVLGTDALYRGIIPEGFTAESNLLAANIAVEYDFLPAYGMELVAGRTFSRDYPTDAKEAFIINETAVREYKWGTAEQALGKTINREGKKGKVIGVVKDFNFMSLTTPIASLVLSIDPTQFNTLSIKFEGENSSEIVKRLEAEWNNIFPEKSFEFSFLDEDLHEQYASFQHFGSIVQSFSIIAILISCLGVYGLVMFTVRQKVKEIGVRKVLGASVQSVLMLVYKDFILLTMIGFMVAAPFSYYLLQRWLNNFVYHTTIDAIIYAVSFLLVLMIVSATISYQVLRAASANPVDSLRSE